MIKILPHIKKIPSLEALRNLKWYVVFVGTVNNISGVDYILKNNGLEESVLWAPTYQEYCRFRSHLLLTDRLIYPGYVFTGFIDDHQLGRFLREISADRKGILLGDGNYSLTEEDVKNLFSVAVKYSEAPKVMFDVNPGDTVTISSGPLSGLPAVVDSIQPSGNVTLNVFFLSRELQVHTSVLDIQSFGYAYEAE